MKTLKCLIILNIAALLFCGAAEAQDFIFKYRDDVYAQGFAMPMSADFEQKQLMDEIYLSDNEEMLKEMYEAGLIEYYGPDAMAEIMELPDDPDYYDFQMGYEFKLTNSNVAVNNGKYDGRGVKVGIIDTGLISGHRDINYDRVNMEQSCDVTAVGEGANSGNFTDYQGHGTMVAGVIAAVTNNNFGVASLAPSSELVIIKAFPGSSGSTAVSNLVLGLNHAVEVGCDVINMSVGARGDDKNTGAAMKSMEDAINKATEQGIIVVAAAGNHDNNDPNNKNDLAKDSPFMYPGAFENVISVASVDGTGNYSSFSYHNSMVNIAACGGSVRVLNFRDPSGSIDGGTTNKSGTSFASPFVASVAALVKQAAPDTDAGKFKELLYSTATDMGDPGWDTFYGAGIINVGNILNTVLGLDPTNSIQISEPQLSFNDEKYPGQPVLSLDIRNSSLGTLEGMSNIWYTSVNGMLNRIEADAVPPILPGDSVTVKYVWGGTGDVVHMLWDGETLEPLAPKSTYAPMEYLQDGGN